MAKVTELVAKLAADAIAERGCELWDVEYGPMKLLFCLMSDWASSLG